MLRDGAVIGPAFAAVTLLFFVSRSSSAVALGLAPVLVWLVALTLVGLINAAVLYAFVVLAGGGGRRRGGETRPAP